MSDYMEMPKDWGVFIKPLENATCLLGDKGCYQNGKCHYIGDREHKVKTNADRIRAMSDEELARELSLVAGWERMQYKKAKRIGIENVILDWLKQPAEGD
jgi:hypothetical protein